MSAPDAINAFLETMALEGIKPVEPIAMRLASGQLIRFRCDGDGQGRQNGWAILHLDARPAGAFGNYRLGLRRNWKGGEQQLLTSAEREALRSEWAEAKKRRLEERRRAHELTAWQAHEIWRLASPASAAHPYIVAKQVDPSPLRQAEDRLFVPMRDVEGKIWNLQRIAGDGEKRFLRGGRTEGLGCLIGYNVSNPTVLCVGEGYATMAAVHRATGYPCLAAFSAANLATVARIYRAARPEVDYIICADNDAHLNGNVGINAARAAAREINAKVAVPPISGDFDDVARTMGLAAVREAIRGAQ